MKALSKLVLDPAVTLDYEAHGIPEDAQEAGFLDWLCSFVAVGDDGQKYWFGCSPLILDAEITDMWHFEIGWETGEVVQSPTSIFKIANYPPVNITGQHVYPQGTLKIDRNEDFVKITVGENFQVVCKTDHTWHYTLKDEDRGIHAEFVHHGVGFPTWYGKERPSYLTQHSFLLSSSHSIKSIQGSAIIFNLRSCQIDCQHHLIFRNRHIKRLLYCLG